MPNRTLILTLVVLAAVLVIVPLLGMLTMAGGPMGGGMMSGMAGMHMAGYVWLIATIAVVAALVALVVRGGTKA